MSDSLAPKAIDWSDVQEVLHAVANTITMRTHYGESHPAVGTADEAVSMLLARALDVVPEMVVALVDGEFVVSERPLPQLRERLHVLAESMARHQIECIVFQRGVRKEEATVLAQVLSSPADVSGTSGRSRDLAQQRMSHVLFRFIGAKADDESGAEGTGAAYLLPAAEEVLLGAARALGEGADVDTGAVLGLATRIVNLVRAGVVSLEQRSWARTVGDEAAHAANVAQITAAIAIDAGYTDRECIDVTAAALLHDIGHLFVPAEIRGIPEPLLDAVQRPVFRNHTYAGASLLLGSGCSPLWIAVAFEHHRGIDGGGYPALESKSAPHDLVRVVALANFFDRKRTRIQGQGDDPEPILRAAADLESRFFGRGLVGRFVRALGVFPPGTVVELSDRTPAVVTRANGADPLRPHVRLLRGPRAGRVVDLRDALAAEGRFDRSITRSVLPPLMLPSDVVTSQQDPDDDAIPVIDAFVDDPWSAVTPVRTRPVRPPLSPGPTSADVAARELSGMGALLDDLLSVPASVTTAPLATPRRSSEPAGRKASVPEMLAAAVVMPPPKISVSSVTVPPGAMESRPPPRPSRELPRVTASSIPSSGPLPKPTRTSFTSAPPEPLSSAEDIEVMMMVGRWEEAARACEAWLGVHPGDVVVAELEARCLLNLSPAARSQAHEIRDHLDAVPTLAMTEAETFGLPLGPAARFVLTLVDGVADLETIADASGLPSDEAHGILSDLLQRGVLALR